MIIFLLTNEFSANGENYKKIKMKSITFMKEYAHGSFEEHRLADLEYKNKNSINEYKINKLNNNEFGNNNDNFLFGNN